MLCEHIPEIGGRWTKTLQVAAKTHRELALHRASLYVGGPNEYVPELFLDPVEARELIDDAAETEQAFEEKTDELFDELGFT